LFLAGKIFDAYLDMHAICAAHHKLFRKYIKDDNEIIDEQIINGLREKICIAEAGILKTIKYNLNFEMPYPYLDELSKKYFRETNREVYYMSRMILLDMFRAGLSIFYHHANLTVAAVVLGFKLQCGCLTPLHFERQVFLQHQSASGYQTGVTPGGDRSISHEARPSDNQTSPYPRGSNYPNTPHDSIEEQRQNGASQMDNSMPLPHQVSALVNPDHSHSNSLPNGLLNKENGGLETSFGPAHHSQNEVLANGTENRGPERIENELECKDNDKRMMTPDNKVNKKGEMQTADDSSEFAHNLSRDKSIPFVHTQTQLVVEAHQMILESLPNDLNNPNGLIVASTLHIEAASFKESLQENSTTVDQGVNKTHENEKNVENGDDKQLKLGETQPISAIEEKKLVIPDLFPLGLELKGVGKLCHPIEIDSSQVADTSENMLLFYRWIQELENPNLNVEHIFGRLF
jgi:hypothetical protein